MKPATPLPWSDDTQIHVMRNAQVEQDYEYIRVACHAYPRLVAALKWMTSYVESDYRSAKLGDLTGGKLTEAQALLRELGEQE